MCPTEEESGMLMSSLSVKRSHVWMLGKKGMFGARQGTEQGSKMGQLIQSMGSVLVEVCIRGESKGKGKSKGRGRG